MQLLFYITKHLFYIPPISVIWRPTTSETGAFVTGRMEEETRQKRVCMYVCVQRESDGDLNSW
jgi:hypothetical protein